MSNTRILPTDKNGSIYYGCTTFAEAEKAIADAREDLGRDEVRKQGLIAKIAENMEAAGYAKIAARIRKEYL